MSKPRYYRQDTPTPSGIRPAIIDRYTGRGVAYGHTIQDADELVRRLNGHVEAHGIEVTVTESTDTESDAVLVFIDTDDLPRRNMRIRINDSLIYEGNPENNVIEVGTDEFGGQHFVQQQNR